MSNNDPSKDAQLSAIIDLGKAESEMLCISTYCPLDDFFEEHCDYDEDEQLAIATHICRNCQRFPCPMQ